MSSSHAVVMAARHGRRALKQSAPSIAIIAGTQRSFHVGSASTGASVLQKSESYAATATTTTMSAGASTNMPLSLGSGASSRLASTMSAGNASNSRASNDPLAFLAAAASLSVATATASYTSCESSNNDTDGSAGGLADESEEGNGPNVTVRDGMDAGGSATSKSPSTTDNELPGPADAEEDNAQINTTEEDDDDDPSKDEDTTCSICLINRQGPCRKFWLKFESCMKAHSAEKDRMEREQREKAEVTAAAAEAEKSKSESGEDDEEEEVNDDADGGGEGAKSREEEWDAFMEKAIRPGEDDDDEDDDDDDEDDDDDDEENDEEEESEENENHSQEEDEAIQEENKQEESQSLAERCDKFMIPWISCIQQHRNVYSLISNAFYQKDYIDPLEDTVSDERRNEFDKNSAQIGEECGYVLKFNGVEIDLGNWREHVEADADDGNGFEEEEPTPASPMEEVHLINAYAKFRLTDPKTGQPIEVAYIKDQKGRLLGFDSFTKRDNGSESNEPGTDDGKDGAEKTAASASEDGECTFHIVPGESTSIAAYAIYRGEKKEDEEGNATREDFLYYTPNVPLPGADNQKRS